jgi:surfactin synthase thioesterase subunit
VSSLTSTWFPQRRSAVPTRMRLYCLPHGGGGASVFRSWAASAEPGLEVVPVQLPGRESRLSEPVAHSIREMSDPLADALLEDAGDTPYAVFGHSMGALISFELCHALRSAANPPRALLVSGAAAPQLGRRTPPVHGLDDEEFRRHLSVLGGTPAGLLNDPTWFELLGPVLRADFEACETYELPPRPPLGLTLYALAGSADPVAAPASVSAWSELTSGRSEVLVFGGDHFFVFQHTSEVLRMAAEACLGDPR